MSSDGECSFTQCQICLEVMRGRSPRALSCLHTYCQLCLEGLLKNQPPLNEVQFGPNVSKTTIDCPACRNVTFLGDKGIKGLPINFMLNRVKEEKERIASTGKSVCQNCAKLRAVVECKECESFLCETCNEKHGNVVAFKSHKVIPVGDAGNMEILCLEHKKKANYVCLKCENQVCMKCVLSEKHEGHSDKIFELSIWARQEQKRIATIREEITPIWLNLKERIAKANILNENLAETLKEVKKTAAKARQAINRQEEEYSRKLVTAKEQNAALSRHLKVLRTNADNFMTVSIEMQANETPNFQSLTTMATLASCVIDSSSMLPTMAEQNIKAKFIPTEEWGIGMLIKKEQN